MPDSSSSAHARPSRRQVLAGFTTLSLAGCLSRATLGTDPSFTIETDPVPDGFDVALDATLTSEGSSDQPPTITVSLKNLRDEEQTIRLSSYLLGLPFEDTIGEGPDGKTLGLYNRLDHLSYDGCWRGRLWRSKNGAQYKETLAAGEQITADLFLYNSEKTTECWPAGEYRFEQSVPYTVTEQAGDEFETKGKYTWGFTVTVSYE